MIVGHRRVGKTTLAHSIEEFTVPFKQNGQSVVYGRYTMDCPSIYVENPFKFDALIALSQQAKAVFFICDPTKKFIRYAPGFATAFQGKHYGIISKCDLVTDEDIMFANMQLLKLGILQEHIFEFSIQDNHSHKIVRQVVSSV